MKAQPKHSGRRLIRQRGFMLVESLIAITIVGSGILAAVVSLSTSSIAVVEGRESTTVAWLVTSQVELIKASPYVDTPGAYPTVTPPSGYTIQNSTSSLPDGNSFIQDVTIEVFKDGELISTTEMVKINN